MQAIEAQRRRRRLWTAVVGAVAVGVAAVIAIVFAVSGHKQSTPNPPPGKHGLPLRPLSTLGTLKPAPAPGPAGPEAVPIPSAPALGGLASAATGGRVDGVSCQTSEQTVFHIHAHLAIFINGSPRQVPAAVGIPSPQSQSTSSGVIVAGGRCLYWLHTHAADGIVHIESPVQRTFTLGQFFDEWGQPLSSNRLGPVSGRVVAIYNGKVFAGDPRAVPLTARAQIQLEVGSPLVAPQNISFPGGM